MEQVKITLLISEDFKEDIVLEVRPAPPVGKPKEEKIGTVILEHKQSEEYKGPQKFNY